MNNLKQSIIAIYNANKRLIHSGACLGVLLVNIALACHYAELERELRLVTAEREFFKINYDESKRVNRLLQEANDKLQAEYYQLASGSYCIESIEEGNE